MRRRYRWLGVVLLTGLMLAIASGALLLVTPAGVGLVLAGIDRLLPGSVLEVRGWRGSLLGEICADSVAYTQEGLEVRVRSPCVDLKLWESADFLKLAIRSFDAAAVSIRATGADEGPAARTLSLPFPIELERGRVGVLEVNGLALSALETRLRLADADVASESRFDYGDAQIELESAGPWSKLEIAMALALPERVTIGGWLDLTGPELPFEITARIAELPLARFIDRELIVADATLELSGDLDRYRFALAGAFDDAAVGRGDLRLRGAGDFDGLTLEGEISGHPSSEFVGALSGVELAGAIGWRPEFSFDLRADAREVPLAAAGYRALLGGRVHATGGASAAVLELEGINGFLNDIPIAAAARADWRRPTDASYEIDVTHARLDAGDGELRLAGRIGESRLDLNVDGRDFPLELLLGELAGRLSGSGSLRGTLSAPELTTAVVLEALAYPGYAARRIELDLAGGLDAGRASIRVDDAAFLRADDAPLVAGIALEARGAYRHSDNWVLDLDRLGVAYTDQAVGPIAFALGRPTRIEVGEGTLAVAETCLRASVAGLSAAPASICGALRYPDGPIRLRISELALAGFQLPGSGMRLGARVDARLDVDAVSPPVGTATVNLTEIQALAANDASPIRFGNLTLDATVADRVAELTLDTPDDQPLVLEGSVRSTLTDPLLESSLDGRVTANVDRIWAVETFLPISVTYEVSNLRGALALSADVGGTLAEPRVTGGLMLEQAGVDLLAIGAEFSEVEVDATLENSEHVDFSTTGRLGPGTFSVTGDIEALSTAERRLTAALELENARVVDLPDYVADFDGSVALGLRPDALEVGGRVTMTRASLKIESLPETAVAVTGDAVIVGEDGVELEARAQRLRTTDLELILGRDVRLEAFGLNTRLRGELKLRERPNAALEVTGAITLRGGVFEAYGQELTVERGKLTFTGPVDDPVVDVLASRVVPYDGGEVTVSLLLGGTAKALTTEVRSSPLLPEGDALALLMTGRTLSEMSNQEQTNVYSAAIGLGLYGASSLTRGVASTLGLEEIILEQDTAGEVQVGAAVRLRQDLYLRYTYGVFSRLGGVLLRYQLHRRLSVQAQTGDEQSIEIRYGVDN